MKKVLLCALVLLLAASVCFAGGSKEKKAINGIADLEGLKIGVQTGTTGEAWVQENVKGVKLNSFKSGIDAALDLKNGAIDCVVLDELPAQAIVDKNPGLAIVRDAEFSANKEEYAIAVKKGNKAVLDVVNATIKELQANGGYEKLVASFMPVDGKVVIPAVANSESNVLLPT